MKPIRYLAYAAQLVFFLLWMWFWESAWRAGFIILFVYAGNIGRPTESPEERRLSRRDWVLTAGAILVVIALVWIIQAEVIELPEVDGRILRMLLVALFVPHTIWRCLREHKASALSEGIPPDALPAPRS